jgi:putative flippase GtrA
MLELIKKYYNKYKEIVNYLIVGVLTTVLSLAVYYGSVLTFLNPKNSIQLQIANVLSWVAGVIFAYFTNRKFVFKSKEKNKLKEAGSFVLSRLVTLFMDMAIMFLGVTILHGNDKIMKLISQVVVTVSNYIFSKLFVFKKSKKSEIANQEN